MILEYAPDIKNPFIGLYFDKSIGVSRRRLIPVENIKNICWGRQNYDDELRWLIAVISDKGMRLAEAAGLLKSDLEIENDAPHVELKPHPWRPLKTPRSTRLIIQLGRLRGSQKHLRVVLLYFPDTTRKTLIIPTE